jgi:hypothetical protein
MEKYSNGFLAKISLGKKVKKLSQIPQFTTKLILLQIMDVHLLTWLKTSESLKKNKFVHLLTFKKLNI